MEVHRAQNTAHANIESRFACPGSVSCSGGVKNYRTVIIISPAQRTGDFNKRNLPQSNKVALKKALTWSPLPLIRTDCQFSEQPIILDIEVLIVAEKDTNQREELLCS